VRSPPGYDDFLDDARAVPSTGDYELLDVGGRIGTIYARRPRPRSAAALAQMSNGKVKDQVRADYMHLFLADHIPPDDYEKLLYRMVDGELAANTVQRAVQAIGTWGTARPYIAVINLVVITGYHWRSMRAKLAQHGIPDPLRTMTSLHALLDFTEQVTLESLAKSGEGHNAAQKAQMAIDNFMFKLYAPDPNERDEDGRVPVPASFDEDAMEGNFDAFAKLAGS
jgi:hypothetical protein